MVTGKLLVDPIRPGEGVFRILLLGSGIWRGWVDSCAESVASRIAGSISGMTGFTMPPEKV